MSKKLHITLGNALDKLIECSLIHKYTVVECGKMIVYFSYENIAVPRYYSIYTEVLPYVVFLYKNVHYSVGSCIHTIDQVIKKNIYNDHYPDINTNPIHVMNNIEFVVDNNLLLLAKRYYKKYYNLTDISILSNISSIKKKYKQEFNAISQMISQNENNLVNINRGVDNTDMFNEYLVTKNKLVKTLGRLRKEMDVELAEQNKIYMLYIILNTLNGGDIMYFNHFADFRTRRYSKDLLSPITNTLTRHILTYGYYKNVDTNDGSRTSKILSKYFHYIDHLNLQSDVDKIAIIWLLVELAKGLKSQILNTKSSVPLETFIKYGLQLLEERPCCGDFLLELEYEKLIYFVSLIRSGKNNLKFFLLKDSTASVLQHLIQWLRPKYQEVLQFCNLNSPNNSWVDTYSIIINSFLDENIDKINIDSIPFFTRKYLKGVIMTINYGVTLRTAMKQFIEVVLQTKNKKPNLKKLETDFIYFYNYLKSDYEKSIFEKESSSLQVVNTVTVYKNKLSLEYFTLEPKILDIKTLNNRFTITLNKSTTIKNEKKQVRASRANLIHVSDAVFAALVIHKAWIYCIHDEFLTDIYSVSTIIDTANEVFTFYLNDVLVNGQHTDLKTNGVGDIFSIFIIL